MKRPMLWAAALFALGEVTGIYADIFKTSIIFIMLICVAFFAIVKIIFKTDFSVFNIFKIRCFKRTHFFVVIIAFTGGFLNVRLRDNEFRFAGLESTDCYGTVYRIEDNDGKCNIYIHTDRGYNIVVFNAGVFGGIYDDSKEKSGLDGEKKTYGFEDKKDYEKVYSSREDIGSEKTYNYGDRVYVKGELKSFEHNSNPGCFDFKNYYKSKNVFYSIDKSCVSLVDRGESENIGTPSVNSETLLEKVEDFGYGYMNFLYSARCNMRSKLYMLTDEKYAGVFCGILLGDRKAVDELTRLDYQNNGMAHILAISGLHISLLFGAIYELLKRLGLNRYLSGLVCFVLLLSYALMTGFSMSTLRALCMIVISLFAIYTGESYDMPVSLSVAVLVILIYNPFKILDSSVVLSITAIAGVCVGQYILKHIRYFYYVNTPLKKLLAALVISFSVNIIMLPVVIMIYHEITPYGVLVNLLIIPLMTIVVVSGLAAVLVSLVSMSRFWSLIGVSRFSSLIGMRLSVLLIKPGTFVLKIYDLVCKFMYKLPFARINIGRISMYQVFFYYLFIFLILILFNRRVLKHVRNFIYKKRHRWLSRKKCILFVSIYTVLVTFVFLGGLIISYLLSLKELAVFVDVGQGDGILLRSESGVNMVIDGGSTSEKQLGKYTMLPVIKYFGMAHVDYWFISHTDTDHISGLEYILELGERSGIRIDNLVFSYGMYSDDNCKRLLRLADKNGVNVIFMKAGDYVADESFRITCAHPDVGFYGDAGSEGDYAGVGGDGSAGENASIEGDGSAETYACVGGDGSAETYAGVGSDEYDETYANVGVVDINDASLCLSYSSPDLNMLFTGDMGEEALEYMLLHERRYLLSHYDILKVPHHGSKNSINFEFYDLIDFESAVISCGENNRHGHPHEETLERLREKEIIIYRTDEEGAVIVDY